MTFYSHSQQKNGITEGSKLLRVHTQGVLNIALAQLYPNINFGISFESIRQIVETTAKLHDLGKYTSYFQSYLLNQKPIDKKLKQHARLGGYAVYQLFKSLNSVEDKSAIISLYLIFLHHSKLIDISELAGKIDFDSSKVFEAQFEDLKSKISSIEVELEIENLLAYIKFPNDSQIRKEVRHWTIKSPDIRDYFLINYLFSLLIEADKLDASNTQIYLRIALPADSVDVRFGKPNSELSSVTPLSNLTNNELRNYCRAQVIGHLNDNSILQTRLFTLTAPTGIGKTMIALDFALKLKAKIRESEGFEPQIIYALPFVNIIEQALGEYEKTLPEAKILGHYQFADIFGDQDESAEIQYNQKLMQLDTWQCDVVITSFVQFFETLIGNRNKLLKKFNHYAGSIIILDEVQTLRLDQMPIIGAALYYLAKFLGSRIILMTATKPKIFKLAYQEILNGEGETLSPLELLSNHEKVFSVFDRTTIHPMLDGFVKEKNERTEEFIEKVFHTRWTDNKSCLIVCNTVKRSIEVFHALEKYLSEHDLKNPVFYLSTNIVPLDRAGRIKEIRDSLKLNQSPILVATQVVEAGVDLDFDMGFRDVGPIDSIIQVTGRINRNNNPKLKGAPLYIIDFEECNKIYGRMTYEQAKKSLLSGTEIPEREYLNLINQYFDDISDRSSFKNSRDLFKSMKTLKYDSQNLNEDSPVSSFKIIDDSTFYSSVFVEVDEEAKKLRERYFLRITGKISKEDFDKKDKLKFHQHIVSVPKYLTNDLEPINEFDDRVMCVPFEQLDDYYQRSTGFKRETKPTSVLTVL